MAARQPRVQGGSLSQQRARSASPSVRRYYLAMDCEGHAGGIPASPSLSHERQLMYYEGQRALRDRLESKRRDASLKVRHDAHKVEAAAARCVESRHTKDEAMQDEVFDNEIRRTFARAKHHQQYMSGHVGHPSATRSRSEASVAMSSVIAPHTIAARKEAIHRSNQQRREELTHGAKNWEYRVGVIDLYKGQTVQQESRAQQFAALQRRKQDMQRRIKEIQAHEYTRRLQMKSVSESIAKEEKEKKYAQTKVVLQKRLDDREKLEKKERERLKEKKELWQRRVFEEKRVAGQLEGVAARLRSKSATLLHSTGQYVASPYRGGASRSPSPAGIASKTYDRLLGGRSEVLSAMSVATRYARDQQAQLLRTRTPSPSPMRVPGASGAASGGGTSDILGGGSEFGGLCPSRLEEAALKLRLGGRGGSYAVPSSSPLRQPRSPSVRRMSPFRP